MTSELTLNVVFFDEDYAVTSWASSPCRAVEAYYAEIDMYCSPPSDYDSEETPVTIFSIPQSLEEKLAAEFEDIGSDALAQEILRLAQTHPEIAKSEAKVAYVSGEARVQPIEPMTLFGTDDT